MKRSWIKMTAALGMTVVVAFAAWNMPEMVYSVADNHNMQQQENFQLGLKQFAKEGSLEEQLYSLSLCDGMEARYVMNAVNMQEKPQAGGDEELTGIIQSELQQLGEYIEEFQKVFTQTISLGDLVSRELYTAYITPVEEGTSRENITFWKVRFQRTDTVNECNSYELEVILDMEYHKIYSVRFTNKALQEFWNIQVKRNKTKDKDNESWEFINLMQDYYGDVSTRYVMDVSGHGEFIYDEVQEAGDVTTQEYDAISKSKIEGSQSDKEKDEVQIVHRVGGDFSYYNEEEGTVSTLNLSKEYRLMENGVCYMQIGVEDIEEILQL